MSVNWPPAVKAAPFAAAAPSVAAAPFLDLIGFPPAKFKRHRGVESVQRGKRHE